MKHTMFSFTGEWLPIPESEVSLYGTGVERAPESFRCVIPMHGNATVVIFRPSGSMDWYCLVKHRNLFQNQVTRWYGKQPGFPEIKTFAEKLAVGFSLFGEQALRLSQQ